MPTFKLNKLVRDKLPATYRQLGQVATIKQLSGKEHFSALLQKFIEEASEIDADITEADLVDELADLQQVIDDIAKLRGITKARLNAAQREKALKKGGFKQGHFVTDLKLKNDDTWVEYYRKKPDVFPESE